MSDRAAVSTAGPPVRGVVPGMLVAALAAVAASLLGELVVGLSSLVVAVAFGVVIAQVAPPGLLDAGASWAARHVLRGAVVLLGFRLSVGEAFELGGPGLVLVLGVVSVTFAGVMLMGRMLGLSPGLGLLVATGYAICGASAVAAMEGVIDVDEEEVSYAIGLVTLCGTLAIVVLPVLAVPLGLEGVPFGAWVGASVHDVGQVVATASTGGREALETATVVKLSRIVLLGPLVAGVSIASRRRNRTGAAGQRSPLVPAFVIAFGVAAAVRSSGVLADGVLDAIRTAEVGLFTVALVGLGMGVNLGRLRRLGARPLIFGLSAWVLVGIAALLGLRLVHI